MRSLLKSNSTLSCQKEVNMSNQREKSLEEKVAEFVRCAQHRNVRETLMACALVAFLALEITYNILKQRPDISSIAGIGVVIFVLYHRQDAYNLVWKLRWCCTERRGKVCLIHTRRSACPLPGIYSRVHRPQRRAYSSRRTPSCVGSAIAS